ncbi:hypothetical protein ES703_76420 [subsurface metagenome]
MQQDVSIFKNGFECLGVSHKVRGYIAFIKLHTFDDSQLIFHPFAFFDFDDAFFADLVHCICQDFADLAVVVCTDSRHFCNITMAFYADAD